MEKEKKKVYMRPVSACTRVSLESPICSSSTSIEVSSPHGAGDINAQEVDKEFGSVNNFTGNDAWN